MQQSVQLPEGLATPQNVSQKSCVHNSDILRRRHLGAVTVSVEQAGCLLRVLLEGASGMFESATIELGFRDFAVELRANPRVLQLNCC